MIEELSMLKLNACQDKTVFVVFDRISAFV